MKSGLEDVVAASTILSDVDGLAGRLVIRGVSLDDLVPQTAVEDCVALLWQGFFDIDLSRGIVGEMLGQARKSVFAHVAAIDPVISGLAPVEAMRALIARISDGDDLAKALQLLAAPAVFVPALLRQRRGLQPVAPEATRSHAADILHMLHGSEPNVRQVAALDTYLVTVSDHGFNASTFAARVVASTQAGLTSSLLAAIGALKGPLHGGAPGPVLDMLDAIAASGNASAWLDAAVQRGERLMGFGHRIYKVRDPRADALKLAFRSMGQSDEAGEIRLKLAEHVEAAAIDVLKQRKPDRALETNVEFYTALLLEALGFAREAFTGVFAMGRSIGWVAHCREQVAQGRLIRPMSVYVGPKP